MMPVENISNTEFIKATDTATTILLLLLNEDGTNYDLTDKTITARFLGAGKLLLEKQVTTDDNGYVVIRFDEGDYGYLGIGTIQAEIVVTDGTDTKIFPNDGYLEFGVVYNTKSLLKNNLNVITLQTFEQSFSDMEILAYRATERANAAAKVVEDLAPTIADLDSIADRAETAATNAEDSALSLSESVEKINNLHIDIKNPGGGLEGAKGDGTPGDAARIQAIVDANRYATLFAPDGVYGFESTLVLKDVSFELSNRAEFKALSAMNLLLEFNTDRKINTIDDLSQENYFYGGILNGNFLANEIFVVSKFLNYKFAPDLIKNGLKSGVVTNPSFAVTPAAEFHAPHLRFINEQDTNVSDNVAIRNLGTDNYFGVVTVQDWTVAVEDRGNGDFQYLHHWIRHTNRFADSVTLNSYSNTIVDKLFVDTIRVGVIANVGIVRIGSPKTYFNPVVYTSDLQQSYPAKFMDAKPGTRVSIFNGRINATNVTNGYTFVASISQNVESVNNKFEGNVINAFSSSWSPFYTTGMYLTFGDLSKGLLGTTATKAYFRNLISGKQLDINDDGTLTYDNSNVSPITGTFTPTIAGSTTSGSPTYTVQQGRYTKVGKTIRCNVVIAGTFDSAIAGGLYIKGLPFEMVGTEIASVSFGYLRNLFQNPVGYVNAGSTKDLQIRYIDPTGTSTSYDTTQLRGKQFEYHLSFTYTSAS